jgi:hypothetical protein
VGAYERHNLPSDIWREWKGDENICENICKSISSDFNRGVTGSKTYGVFDAVKAL